MSHRGSYRAAAVAAEQRCFGVQVSTPERIAEQVKAAWGAAVGSHASGNGSSKRSYEICLEGEWRPFSSTPPPAGEAWRGLLVQMVDREVKDGRRAPYPVAVSLAFPGWRRQEIEGFLKRKSLSLEKLSEKQIIVAVSLAFFGGQIHATAHMVKVVADQGRYKAALAREKRRAAGGTRLRARKSAKKRDLPPLRRGGRVTVIGPKVSDHTYKDVFGHLGRVKRSDLTIVPRRVAVAGPHAAWEICEAVRTARRDSDLVLLYRGGGSEIDFWPFQTAEVANAVSICTEGAPVLTAIGHAADKTLADRRAYRAFDVPSQMASVVRNTYARKEDATYVERLRRDVEAERRAKAQVADDLERTREEVLAARRGEENAKMVETSALVRARRSLSRAEAHADLADLRRHARSLRWLTVMSVVSALAILLSTLVDAPGWTVLFILPILLIAAACERMRSRGLRECGALRKRVMDGGGRDPWAAPRPLPALLQTSPAGPEKGSSS